MENIHTENNVVWHNHTVTREQREKLHQQNRNKRRHKSAVIWFTGLSGSGKSTLANAVEQRLYEEGCRTFILDGDNIRHGLSSDLGFSENDRQENIRRVGEVAKLFLEAGVFTITAFISPLVKEREKIRKLYKEDFIEIHCNCPLEICEQRDVKGFYQMARDGTIKNFTGISSPYESPANPELTLNTSTHSVDQCVDKVTRYLSQNNFLF